MNIEFIRWLYYETDQDFLRFVLDRREYRLWVYKHIEFDHIEEEQKEEATWNEIMLRYPRFKMKIAKIIMENPDILQTDIKTRFPCESPWEDKVSGIVKKFSDNGKVYRQKVGTTYEVRWIFR